MSKTHLVIPDTQIQKGVPLDHIEALGKLILDQKPEVIVIIGDWFDMPSLCMYNNVKEQENRRIIDDLKAGKDALDLLMGPMMAFNERQRKTRHKQYLPRRVFLFGNHEERILRIAKGQPKMETFFSYDSFGVEKYGFETVEFPKHIEIDGITYAHFFTRTNSPTAMSRSHLIRQQYNFSTTSGHQPGLDYTIAAVDVKGARIQNLIAGSFYMHNEDYKTPLANTHWRGVIIKHHVRDGQYDPCFLSIEGLLSEYGC